MMTYKDEGESRKHTTNQETRRTKYMKKMIILGCCIMLFLCMVGSVYASNLDPTTMDRLDALYDEMSMRMYGVHFNELKDNELHQDTRAQIMRNNVELAVQNYISLQLSLR